MQVMKVLDDNSGALLRQVNLIAGTGWGDTITSGDTIDAFPQEDFMGDDGFHYPVEPKLQPVRQYPKAKRGQHWNKPRWR